MASERGMGGWRMAMQADSKPTQRRTLRIQYWSGSGTLDDTLLWEYLAVCVFVS